MLHGYHEHRDLRYVNEKRAACFCGVVRKGIILEGECPRIVWHYLEKQTFRYSENLLFESRYIILVFSSGRNSIILGNL